MGLVAVLLEERGGLVVAGQGAACRRHGSLIDVEEGGHAVRRHPGGAVGGVVDRESGLLQKADLLIGVDSGSRQDERGGVAVVDQQDDAVGSAQSHVGERAKVIGRGTAPGCGCLPRRVSLEGAHGADSHDESGHQCEGLEKTLSPVRQIEHGAEHADQEQILEEDVLRRPKDTVTPGNKWNQAERQGGGEGALDNWRHRDHPPEYEQERGGGGQRGKQHVAGQADKRHEVEINVPVGHQVMKRQKDQPQPQIALAYCGAERRGCGGRKERPSGDHHGRILHDDDNRQQCVVAPVEPHAVDRHLVEDQQGMQTQRRQERQSGHKPRQPRRPGRSGGGAAAEQEQTQRGVHAGQRQIDGDLARERAGILALEYHIGIERQERQAEGGAGAGPQEERPDLRKPETHRRANRAAAKEALDPQERPRCGGHEIPQERQQVVERPVEQQGGGRGIEQEEEEEADASGLGEFAPGEPRRGQSRQQVDERHRHRQQVDAAQEAVRRAQIRHGAERHTGEFGGALQHEVGQQQHRHLDEEG